MKLTSLASAFFLTSGICVSLVCLADVHVDGYTRKDGSYVQPHYRSSPDGDFSNNWSTLGNINPHTGSLGMRTSPDAVPATEPYQTPITAADDERYSGYDDDEELDQFYPNSDEH